MSHTPDRESTSDDDMARADVANGERPEQPESREHSTYDRRRADEDAGEPPAS
jgi:hypothetical protein